MDWVWRICLGFGAMLLVRETDIWMVADYRTDGGLIINSLVYGAIVMVGVSPLFNKMFPRFFGGKRTSNSTNQNRKQPKPKGTTTQSERAYLENATDLNEQSTKFDLSNAKSITINSPEHLDYSKRCVIHWFVKEGDFVTCGDRVFTVSETVAYNEEKKTFTLTADKEYQIGKRHVGTANGADGVIHNKGAPIVELLAKENDVSSDTGDRKPSAEKKLRNVDASRNANNRKRKTKKQIENDLNGLKKLKEDGLISDEVWKEKQKEILKDY